MKYVFNFILKLFYVIVLPTVASLVCFHIVSSHELGTYEMTGLFILLISIYIAAFVLNSKIKSVKLIPQFNSELVISLSIGLLIHEGEIIILVPFVIMRIKPITRIRKTTYYN